MNNDNMECKNFWYQLTEWQESIGDLYEVKQTLDKYHYPYVVKKLGESRFAVFTMGDLLGESREEYLKIARTRHLDVVETAEYASID